VKRLPVLLLAALPTVGTAQVSPTPGFDDPRLQTIAYDTSRPVRLVAFADANLTVMLLPHDQIQRVVMSDQAAFEVRVTGSNDALNIRPLRPEAAATLAVDTSRRRYEFDLHTGEGLAAAYVVRFVPPGAPAQPRSMAVPGVPERAALIGEYRLSGDRVLRPIRISDDGVRMYIEWNEYQSLPAVFGVGPTGEEEVVDGYIRDGVFTIDRIYGELVFRIDRMRARARRLEVAG
jgi:type IV secretion system protein VirB9